MGNSSSTNDQWSGLEKPISSTGKVKHPKTTNKLDSRTFLSSSSIITWITHDHENLVQKQPAGSLSLSSLILLESMLNQGAHQLLLILVSTLIFSRKMWNLNGTICSGFEVDPVITLSVWCLSCKNAQEMAPQRRSAHSPLIRRTPLCLVTISALLLWRFFDKKFKPGKMTFIL